jgi:hypothetical protein
MTTISRFYLAYHDREVLTKAEPPEGALLLHLPSLDLPQHFLHNRFAESRALLWMALNPLASVPAEGYMALFHASYDKKFSRLPKLKDLPKFLEASLQPDIIIGPVICRDYMSQAKSCHPMMDLAIERVLDRVGIPWVPNRNSPMTNSFVAHTDVWRRLLPDWLRMFVAAQTECDTLNFGLRDCKNGVEAAYLLERMTCAWFAAQPDLRIGSMVGEGGTAIYEPVYLNRTAW